jgi:hexosaminidase
MQEDVFCAGNESLYAFLEDILQEVFELFPGEYVHIGGDECPKSRWEDCPRCQKRIKDENLRDEDELQSYFIRRMADFIQRNDKRVIGWDEIIEGGLAPDAIVMSWRGSAEGIEAAIAAHDVVMTPNTHCYFDYYQSRETTNEPPAIGGYIPLETVYKFDPLDGIPDEKHHHVLGGQGNIWTEYIPSPAQVEYMAFPRSLALAEVLWSGPGDDYKDFSERVAFHQGILNNSSVNFRPFDFM